MKTTEIYTDVTLKGAPDYLISYDGEKITVKGPGRGNHRTRATTEKKYILKPSKRYGRTVYVLYVSLKDNARRKKHLTQGMILWLLRHPDVDVRDIDFNKANIDADGNAVAPGKKFYSLQYNLFRSIDDVIETCMIIKRFNEGDASGLFEFIHGSRQEVIGIVGLRQRLGITQAEAAWDDAVDMMLEKVRDMHVMRIQPLRKILCNCLTGAILSRRKFLRREDTGRI